MNRTCCDDPNCPYSKLGKTDPDLSKVVDFMLVLHTWELNTGIDPGRALALMMAFALIAAKTKGWDEKVLAEKAGGEVESFVRATSWLVQNAPGFLVSSKGGPFDSDEEDEEESEEVYTATAKVDESRNTK